jgi:signal transduction histidine kinase
VALFYLVTMCLRSVVFTCSLLFGVLSSYRTKELQRSYIEHMDLLAAALQRLEDAHDRLPVGTEIVPARHILYDLAELDGDSKNIELLSSVAEDQRADGAYLETENLIIIKTTKAGRIRATISLENFNMQIFGLKAMCALLFLGMATLSFGLSKMITETLVKKINSIQDIVEEITKNQKYSHRIPINENRADDELEQLSLKFNGMFEFLEQNQLRILEDEREKARVELAAQVANDLRSPLTSMSLALNDIEKTLKNEPVTLLRSALERLATVTQKISKSHDTGSNNEIPKLTLIDPLILNIVNEQNLRYVVKKIKLHSLHKEVAIWSTVQINELKTALTNLINNALEAQASEVSLTLTAEKSHWVLQIRDNGAGIKKEVIEKIFEHSFTSGKSSERGLHQVKTAIEWNGGNIAVDSVLGLGTTITIRMPKEKEPTFIARSIDLLPEQKICFVDSDPNILEAWKLKTNPIKNEKHFFRSVEEFIKSENLENTVLVIDQNLGNKQLGLDIIKEMKLSSSVYLCTSEFDEQSVQEQIEALKIKLIPKPLIEMFKITTKL